MGVDAEIHFELDINRTKGYPENLLTIPVEPEWLGFQPKEPYRMYEVNDLEHLGRYFSEDYPRGYWPSYAKILLELLRAPAVGRVWYFGDTIDYPHEEEHMTLDDLHELNKQWVAYGQVWYDR